MWNRESDDATLPELSPTGISLSHAPTTQEWMCISFVLDQETGSLITKLNDVEIEGLTIDETPTPDVDRQWLQQKPDWLPAISNFKLGWESYGGGEANIWIDDVILDTQPILCAD